MLVLATATFVVALIIFMMFSPSQLGSSKFKALLGLEIKPNVFRSPRLQKPEMTNVRRIHGYEDYLDELKAYEKQERVYKKTIELKRKLRWVFISACAVFVILFALGSCTTRLA